MKKPPHFSRRTPDVPGLGMRAGQEAGGPRAESERSKPERVEGGPSGRIGEPAVSGSETLATAKETLSPTASAKWAREPSP